MKPGKCLVLLLLVLPALLAAPVYAGDPSRSPTVQGPAPLPFGPAGNDVTTSLGSFKIQIVSKFASMMSSCPNYDPSTRILSSPTLFDPATIIGRSDVSLAGHDIANTPFEVGAVNVGMAGIVVNKDRLLPPPTYPCFTDGPGTPVKPPDHGPCASGTGTRKVDTELRSLKMTNLPGDPSLAITVRAGMHYNEDPFQPVQYADIMTSPGKVQSRSGPSNDPTRDFPATSFFNVYVKVDLPPNYCGQGFPGITLYNQDPLKVVNKMLTQFPPRVVYLHDATSIVPILFLADGPPGPNGPLWYRGDVLGYFLLAGHGVGFGSSQSDVSQFQSFMGSQSNAACPIQ